MQSLIEEAPVVSVVWYFGHGWQALLPISCVYVSRGQGWQTGILSLKPLPLTIRERSVCAENLPGSQLTTKRINMHISCGNAHADILTYHRGGSLNTVLVPKDKHTSTCPLQQIQEPP